MTYDHLSHDKIKILTEQRDALYERVQQLEEENTELNTLKQLSNLEIHDLRNERSYYREQFVSERLEAQRLVKELEWVKEEQMKELLTVSSRTSRLEGILRLIRTANSLEEIHEFIHNYYASK
jgi:uncharacterized coiled-coil DUF342 family protein